MRSFTLTRRNCVRNRAGNVSREIHSRLVSRHSCLKNALERFFFRGHFDVRLATASAFSPHCAPELPPAADSLRVELRAAERGFVPDVLRTNPRQIQNANLPWLPLLY